MHIDGIIEIHYPCPERRKWFSRKHDRQPAERPPPLFQWPEFCGLQGHKEDPLFRVNWPSGILSTLTTKWKLQSKEFPVGKMSMALQHDASDVWFKSASAEQLIKETKLSCVYSKDTNYLNIRSGTAREWNFTKTYQGTINDHKWERHTRNWEKIADDLIGRNVRKIVHFPPFDSSFSEILWKN